MKRASELKELAGSVSSSSLDSHVSDEEDVSEESSDLSSSSSSLSDATSPSVVDEDVIPVKPRKVPGSLTTATLLLGRSVQDPVDPWKTHTCNIILQRGLTTEPHMKEPFSEAMPPTQALTPPPPDKCLEIVLALYSAKPLNKVQMCHVVKNPELFSRMLAQLGEGVKSQPSDPSPEVNAAPPNSESHSERTDSPSQVSSAADMAYEVEEPLPVSDMIASLPENQNDEISSIEGDMGEVGVRDGSEDARPLAAEQTPLNLHISWSQDESTNLPSGRQASDNDKAKTLHISWSLDESAKLASGSQASDNDKISSPLNLHISWPQ
eukprot:Selendium_serpulae@DN4927_c0_g1_i3.p2